VRAGLVPTCHDTRRTTRQRERAPPTPLVTATVTARRRWGSRAAVVIVHLVTATPEAPPAPADLPERRAVRRTRAASPKPSATYRVDRFAASVDTWLSPAVPGTRVPTQTRSVSRGLNRLAPGAACRWATSAARPGPRAWLALAARTGTVSR
jgi:hypothetical protein